MSIGIVCFDCDSTLSKIEGIDELGRRKGLFEQMAALTNAAMNGEMALEDVYGKRLELIQPQQSDLDWLAQLYIEEIVDGVEAVFQALQQSGYQLHIISGGIRQAILPLAKRLGLQDDQVHAVSVYFDAHGHYQDFDRQSPLAKTGGKAEVCKGLKQLHLPMTMIGDGKTDLEAAQAGARVIGFGGVARRELVEKQADIYVLDSSLQSVLAYF
jgi:phosphoserine phosphatase